MCLQIRAELGQPQGIGHDDRHQVMGRDQSQGAGRACPLGEGRDGVGAAVAAPDERGHRLPAVGGEEKTGDEAQDGTGGGGQD